MTETFRVLFVCTANICRSPMAEHMMRSRLHDRLGSRAEDRWLVRSAGTDALVGAPMHDFTRRVLAEHGIPAPAGAARQLTTALVERSELVLTATRAHRTVVARLSPVAARRAFTVRQFARLCRAGRSVYGADPKDGWDLLEMAAAGRTRSQPASEEADSISDPMGKDLRAFHECGDITDRCLAQIVGSLVADH